jgi:hypothetical protein
MTSDKANSYMENKKEFIKRGGILGYRHRMVQHALKNGISATARKFDTTRKTVRKWVNEFNKFVPDDKLSSKDNNDAKLKCLKNKSRLGQHHPNKISDNDLEKIIKARSKTNLGAYFIKDLADLNCSVKTINKKLKQNDLVNKQKTKYRKKKDNSIMRNSIKPIEKFQIDLKYLCDIPNILSDYLHGLIPKYQITARDYKSGMTFIGFSNHKDSTGVAIFVAYVIHCLKKSGIDLSETHFQSDNGSEFKLTTKKNGLSLYEYVLNKYNIECVFNPVGKPTYNSDVESFHNRIECEFYNIEKYGDINIFLKKAWVYMIWYNCYRKNRNKQNKSPLTILKEYFTSIEQPEKCKGLNRLLTYPPILVDNYIKDIELVKEGGYLKWLSPKKLIFVP